MMMKIAKVEPLPIGRYLYVRITTESGLVGIGESGTWGHLEASAAAIAKFGAYLVGRDARPIEHHWNVMLPLAPFHRRRDHRRGLGDRHRAVGHQGQAARRAGVRAARRRRCARRPGCTAM